MSEAWHDFAVQVRLTLALAFVLIARGLADVDADDLTARTQDLDDAALSLRADLAELAER